MKVKCHQISSAGTVRDHNEDFLLFWEPEEFDLAQKLGSIAILADGVGGENHGDIASQLAAETALAAFKETDPAATPTDVARRIFDAAAAKVFQAAQDKGRMATTLLASIYRHDKVTIAHVGDSRLYRLRDNRFEQMTLDHSLLQELVDRGFYSPEEAQRATNKNYVTRALGVEQNVEVEIHEQPVQKSDYYVLCSDGLSDMIEDEDIHLTISTFSANLDTVAKQLIQLSNDNGGRDNVSVIMAHIAEPFPAHRRIFDKILGWFG